ncbi:MAG: VIT1/CCC1 transporter family protein [Bacteroidota bacterium]|jgi:VIT1/CCC1 family predicted Fe2+/Mn2+ transporter
MTSLTQKQLAQIIQFQRNEITEYAIYKQLSERIRNQKNAEVLASIAEDEKKHYEFWKQYTGKEVKSNRLKVIRFYLLARIFGVIFSVKLLEKGEQDAQVAYAEMAKIIPGAKSVVHDEDKHEEELIELLKEKKLNYVGSIVLGLNDALVELTGALAGLTFALQNTQVVALAGLITGIAASFSMGASEYLSQKSEGSHEEALKSSLYTGIAYIVTVMILIMPYLLFDHLYLDLGLTLFLAILIIFLFNYYISVAKGLNFKRRFFEMATLSLGVAAITFGLSFFIRKFFGIDL